MSVVSMRELLEAGVHFGHQTRRWNPKMKRFIFTERGGIYIIDLQQTLELLEEAHDFARNIAGRGGSILFVGTKKQSQDAISEHAARVGMPFVNHRWLGGLLTNWRTMSERIERLHELRRLNEDGQLELLPPKERMTMLSELEKLEANLGGVADMRKQPDAVFIVDLRKEQLAVREARRLGLPVVALVDTNCDPDEADYVIPGNDDAIRSCSLIVRAIADGVASGQSRVVVEEFGGAEASNGQPAAEAAQPPERPVRDSGPGEGAPGEPGGSPADTVPPVRDSGPGEGAPGEPGGSPADTVPPVRDSGPGEGAPGEPGGSPADTVPPVGESGPVDGTPPEPAGSTTGAEPTAPAADETPAEYEQLGPAEKTVDPPDAPEEQAR